MVEVNSSEMQPEGNLSFDPVWYVFFLRQLSFLLVTVLLSRSSHFMVSAYGYGSDTD